MTLPIFSTGSNLIPNYCQDIEQEQKKNHFSPASSKAIFKKNSLEVLFEQHVPIYSQDFEKDQALRQVHLIYQAFEGLDSQALKQTLTIVKAFGFSFE